MVSLQVERLRKTFPGVVALDSVDLDVRESEYVVILGPTGSGKTTLLKTIAGLTKQDSGHIRFGDQVVDGLPPFDRSVAYLPQNYSLFGHLTVWDNVAFGPSVQGWDPRRVDQITREMLNLVHLSHRRDSYPRELSGGMQQRVALARALATQAKILLLDEPLRALDARLRIELRKELSSLAKDLGITTLHVTHDQEEAIAIADRIAVIRKGRIVQLGGPREVYDAPSSPFVANFVGEANFFIGVLSKSTQGSSLVALESGSEILARESSLPIGSSVAVAVKSDRCELHAGSRPGENAFSGVVSRVLFLGKRSSLELASPLGTLKAKVPSARARTFPEGSEVTFSFQPEHGIVFPSPPEGLAQALEVE